MRKLLACLFISINCFSIVNVVGQSNANLDTLTSVFNRTKASKHDSLIRSFYSKLENQHIDQASSFMNYVLQLDVVENNYSSKITAHGVLANLYSKSGINATAMRQAALGFEIAENNNDTLLMVQLRIQEANIYRVSFAFDREAESYHFLINLLKGSRYQLQLATAYNRLSHLEFNHVGVSTDKDRNNLINHTLLAIEALKMVQFSKDEDRTSALMSAYNTLGLSYLGSDNEKAIEHFITARILAEKINNKFWISLISSNMATIYIDQGKLDTALVLVELDMMNSIEKKSWGSAIQASLQMGTIYIEKQMYTEALHSYIAAERLIDDHQESSPALRHLYKCYADYYEVTEHWEKAHFYREKYFIISDSLASVYQKQKIREAQIIFDFNKQKSSIELLSEKNELLDKKIELRNYLSIVSIAFVLFVSTFLFVLFRKNRENKNLNAELVEKNSEIEAKNEELTTQSNVLEKQNIEIHSHNDNLETEVSKRTEQLEKSNRELDMYLYRASHDLRGPISSILGLYEVSKMTTDHQEISTVVREIGVTANQMDAMLDKMKSIYLLYKNIFHPQEIRFDDLIFDFKNKYRNQISKCDIKIKCKIAHTHPIYIDVNLITMVLFNIAENSIYYHNSRANKAHIQISTQTELNDRLIITIQDNGIGIQEQYIGKIFDSNFRANAVSMGNGLGLFIAKRATESLGGSISVKSTFGEGSTFTISIPNT